MKILSLLLLILFSCSFYSCQKGITVASLQNQLQANWELRQVDGGFNGAYTFLPAGNGNTIAFYNDNRFIKTTISGGVTYTDTGTYNIFKGATCYSNEVTFIQFLPDSAAYVLSVSGNTMNINANTCIMADVPDRTYAKLK